MDKLKLDQEAAAFLEDIIATVHDAKIDCNLCVKLLDNLKKTYHDENIRDAAARASRVLLLKYNEKVNEFFDKVVDSYQTAYKKSDPKMDDLGRKKINPLKDGNSDHRQTLARILVECTPLASTKSINKLITFFIPGALSDRNTRVQETMLEAACVLVNEHGSKRTQFFMSSFQMFLTKTANSVDSDDVRKNVIVLLGTMAKHLDSSDPQIKTIMTQLVQALNTPSQMVQEAVAKCFPPLIETYRKDYPAMLKELNKTLYEGSDYGQRKGAAYGIAGIVRGVGYQALKQQTGSMKKSLQDSKINKKIGALIGIEVFTLMMGRLFEPHIIQLLPSLLICFADTTTAVRDATEETTKILMKEISATGVRMILPMLLKAVDQDAWRTKVGSVQLLVSMGNCRPKQLSLCLPSIVPKVIEVLGDSHMKVQEVASHALKQLCQAIKNPEISSLSKKIMSALLDPAKETHSCLLAITKLEFKHSIDAASLSLIMPILQRGFKERSSETRKISAQIVGSLNLLTDQRDISPYLKSVLPGIKTSILDPVPEVRAVTAAALGALIKASGDEILAELMPWLLEKLTSNSSQVDRSGAAQAIVETVGALGGLKLDQFMDQIILTIKDPNLLPHMKDGYLMLFIYFPVVMKEDFSRFIGRIVIPILDGLAEDVDYVRETALLAGQRIVNMYPDSAVKLLLPELEIGILEENWRIRYSSTKLIGDLLYKISGIMGKSYSDAAGEDEISDGKPEEEIIKVLGMETRNRVLSGIYMCRSDVSQEVKHAALHIWKMCIGNTPKTLREILPTLCSILLDCLAGDNDEKQLMALRALSDLIKKVGERVLPDIVPILDARLGKTNECDKRKAVAIALNEIIISTGKDQMASSAFYLIPTIRKALSDSFPEVRESAAVTFDNLYQAIGLKALEEVIPPLIKQLGDPNLTEAILDGLRQIMILRSRVMLPYILPILTDHQPVNTRALAALAPVAGESLARHLPKILPALLLTLSRKLGTKDEKRESSCCSIIFLSAYEISGSQIIIEQLLQSTKSTDVKIRSASVILLNNFCHEARLIPLHVSQVLRALIRLYIEGNGKILEQAWDAINCLTRSMDITACVEFIDDIRFAVHYAIGDLKAAKQSQETKKGEINELFLPGLSSPQGFLALATVYRETIINGPAEKKELAANSLCEIITYSNLTSTQANTMKIGGILLRLFGEFSIKGRHSNDVKIAFLDTLIMLMKKVGNDMRPFKSQCDYVIKKMLNDYHVEVKQKAEEVTNLLTNISVS